MTVEPSVALIMPSKTDCPIKMVDPDKEIIPFPDMEPTLVYPPSISSNVALSN